MTHASGQGFGYVTSAWVDDDDLISLSSDSNLSSTSLLKTLIEPSPSEEIFFKEDRDDSEEEVYRQTRESVRVSISYFRKDERVEGLNIDYQKQKKRDEQRRFSSQNIPVMSERSRRKLLRKFSAGEQQKDDLIIPLMSHFGLKPRESWKGRPSGQVAELLSFMNSNPIPLSSRRRSMYIKLVKEKLDEEENELYEDQEEETEEEKKKREERKTEEKKREEQVLSSYSERERVVIKEALGRVPTMRKSVFIPFGKENILATHDRDSENFFTDEAPRIPSYDEYYSRTVDFGNIRVRSSADYG